MDFDAFEAGVAPGGLRTKSDIRVLLCYLLASTGAPLKPCDLFGIMQENSLANYFEVTEALSELQQKGCITPSDEYPGCVTVSDAGREIARQLDGTLPVSVREKAIDSALNLLAKAKREEENKVEIQKNEKGYFVTCHISDNDMDLMVFTLYAPDLYQARLIKRTFHRNPGYVYRMMLATVTGNRDLAENILNGRA